MATNDITQEIQHQLTTAIEDFKAIYEQQKEDFAELTKTVEATLRESNPDGVKYHITSRTKNVDSAGKSAMRRQIAKIQKSGLNTQDLRADKILDAMPDLAGIRITLYYPNHYKEWEDAINENFESVDPSHYPLIWGDEGAPNPYKSDYESVFRGYRGRHYRVREKATDSTQSSRRRVEIQVTSLIMHCWADVHHTLVYKPAPDGSSVTTVDEQTLDLLNGIVLVGEIGLNKLHASIDRRLAELDRPLEDAYELANWVRHQVLETQKQDDQDRWSYRMKHANTVFEILSHWKKTKPKDLQPLVQAAMDTDPELAAKDLFKALIYQFSGSNEVQSNLEGLISSDPSSQDHEVQKLRQKLWLKMTAYNNSVLRRTEGQTAQVQLSKRLPIQVIIEMLDTYQPIFSMEWKDALKEFLEKFKPNAYSYSLAQLLIAGRSQKAHVQPINANCFYQWDSNIEDKLNPIPRNFQKASTKTRVIRYAISAKFVLDYEIFSQESNHDQVSNQQQFESSVQHRIESYISSHKRSSNQRLNVESGLAAMLLQYEHKRKHLEMGNFIFMLFNPDREGGNRFEFVSTRGWENYGIRQSVLKSYIKRLCMERSQRKRG